jgi:hypothetical protein
MVIAARLDIDGVAVAQVVLILRALTKGLAAEKQHCHSHYCEK